MVSGFYSLNAEFLIEFLKKWRLNCLVQLENERIQLLLSATPFEVEPDASLRAARIDYDAYSVEEQRELKKVVAHLDELPILQMSVVMMPRVMHLQFVPKIGLQNQLLNEIYTMSSVKEIRFGGVKGCIEIILFRPKPEAKKRGNIIRVRTKNMRRVRLSAKTQVITPNVVSLEQ